MKARLWQALLAIDCALNVLFQFVPMPGAQLGSGRWETLCRHWHRLEHRHGIWWAGKVCAFVGWAFRDCEHCKKASE